MDDLDRCKSMRQWLRNGLCCIFIDMSDLRNPVVEIGGSADSDAALHEQSIQPWKAVFHIRAGSRWIMALF